MPTFEIHGTWLVELCDEHGLLLLAAAERGHALWAWTWIATVRASAVANKFEVRPLPYGLAYFVALDENGAAVATSPTFPTVSDCQRAMRYVRGTIPFANVRRVSGNATRGGERGAAPESPSHRREAALAESDDSE